MTKLGFIKSLMTAVIPLTAISIPVQITAQQIEPQNFDMPAPVTHLSPTLLMLSREECIEIALSQSPTIKVADLEVVRYDYSKKETLASLFPQIDFQLAYQRSIKLQTVTMDFGGQTQKMKMGSDNTWNTGFSVSLPIIAPTLWKAISLSDSQILASLESARSSRLELINQVNQAYYSLLLANSSKEVIKENYEIAKITADIFEKQFKQGTASEYDVLRSSVQVKNIEPELLQADIAIRQCELQLKVLMGMGKEVEIHPTIKLEDLQRDMYVYQLDDRSLSNNSSLRSLDISTETARKNVTLKKFEYLPTLGASYNLNWLALSNGSPFKNQEFSPYSNVALSLNVPIFSGGKRYNAVRQAKVQVKELELQRENLVNSLNMQVELALDNINRQARQIETSKEGVGQAVKAHEIMQKSFEIGAASYLELRDSELAETSARLSYLQSIYNFLVSSSELDMLLGRENSLITSKN
ncbi:MAG: TolC family protein [Muribaculaceae bacterium]|nr:TolC family protein [Muribaculaceae bacterium]